MKMVIKNKKTGKSYSVITKDTKQKDEDIKKLTDEIEEKEEEKIVEETQTEDTKKDDTELTKEEIEALKELVSLLPELKKLALKEGEESEPETEEVTYLIYIESNVVYKIEIMREGEVSKFNEPVKLFIFLTAFRFRFESRTPSGARSLYRQAKESDIHLFLP